MKINKSCLICVNLTYGVPIDYWFFDVFEINRIHIGSLVMNFCLKKLESEIFWFGNFVFDLDYFQTTKTYNLIGNEIL